MISPRTTFDHSPYAMFFEGNILTFRIMAFGTYGTGIKTVAWFGIGFGMLLMSRGIIQFFQSEKILTAGMLCIFGLVSLIISIGLRLIAKGIVEAKQYRYEHQGRHPKDTLYTYNISSQTLIKIRGDSTQVLTQGSAPTYRVRKTSSRGGFAGYLFTLAWSTASAVVMLAPDESEKTRIEQVLQHYRIQKA